MLLVIASKSTPDRSSRIPANSDQLETHRLHTYSSGNEPNYVFSEPNPADTLEHVDASESGTRLKPYTVKLKSLSEDLLQVLMPDASELLSDFGRWRRLALAGDIGAALANAEFAANCLNVASNLKPVGVLTNETQAPARSSEFTFSTDCQSVGYRSSEDQLFWLSVASDHGSAAADILLALAARNAFSMQRSLSIPDHRVVLINTKALERLRRAAMAGYPEDWELLAESLATGNMGEFNRPESLAYFSALVAIGRINNDEALFNATLQNASPYEVAASRVLLDGLLERIQAR